ncbi:hypothetical protein A1OO_10635 [Enterovibrio norvegicus FF-33]|uniref:Uncharacterized protein n=1 Tax=Enterovibrio norvegicus FF-454 TaxID=1185651 RepID=A0A1E5C8L9_9GAMM|nr:hypothetical protein [Enterovibrio norvegicus]OEE61542.1 hypothetical protein A1OK_09295 [Enterovibrio norvegicus FF-454]OEE66241.1 hypothetical protein A1OO_10635 [Enterovibrio norvegicus FF-33]OEE74274.1 hypothetical protein A1OQ_09630 [Enterovibrio norvegicus FF-162]
MLNQHHSSPQFTLRGTVINGMLLFCFISSYGLAAESNTTTNQTEYGYSDLYGELTPTQVYSLVKNIDSMVMHYAYRYKPKISSSLPRNVIPVKNYRPEQVFLALAKLGDDIDLFAKQVGTPVIKRVKRQGSEAIPAEVFLLAGACLDSLSTILATLEPHNSFGDFYSHRHYERTRTPSDVYALVDLIHRKLTVLVGEQSKLDE